MASEPPKKPELRSSASGGSSSRSKKPRKAMTKVLRIRSEGITDATKQADIFALLHHSKHDLKMKSLIPQKIFLRTKLIIL